MPCQYCVNKPVCDCPWGENHKDIERLSTGWGNLGPWIAEVQARLDAIDKRTAVKADLTGWREWQTSHPALQALRKMVEADGFEIKVIVRRRRDAESERIGQRGETKD